MRIRRDQTSHRAQLTNKHLLCLLFLLAAMCVALLPTESVSAGGALDRMKQCSFREGRIARSI